MSVKLTLWQITVSHQEVILMSMVWALKPITVSNGNRWRSCPRPHRRSSKPDVHIVQNMWKYCNAWYGYLQTLIFKRSLLISGRFLPLLSWSRVKITVRSRFSLIHPWLNKISVRPHLTDTLAIKSARHAIRERVQHSKFIPNDVYATQQTRFQIITGNVLSWGPLRVVFTHYFS